VKLYQWNKTAFQDRGATPTAWGYIVTHCISVWRYITRQKLYQKYDTTFHVIGVPPAQGFIAKTQHFGVKVCHPPETLSVRQRAISLWRSTTRLKLKIGWSRSEFFQNRILKLWIQFDSEHGSVRNPLSHAMLRIWIHSGQKLLQIRIRINQDLTSSVGDLNDIFRIWILFFGPIRIRIRLLSDSDPNRFGFGSFRIRIGSDSAPFGSG